MVLKDFYHHKIITWFFRQKCEQIWKRVQTISIYIKMFGQKSVNFKGTAVITLSKLWHINERRWPTASFPDIADLRGNGVNQKDDGEFPLPVHFAAWYKNKLWQSEATAQLTNSHYVTRLPALPLCWWLESELSCATSWCGFMVMCGMAMSQWEAQKSELWEALMSILLGNPTWKHFLKLNATQST